MSWQMHRWTESDIYSLPCVSTGVPKTKEIEAYPEHGCIKTQQSWMQEQINIYETKRSLTFFMTTFFKVICKFHFTYALQWMWSSDIQCMLIVTRLKEAEIWPRHESSSQLWIIFLNSKTSLIKNILLSNRTREIKLHMSEELEMATAWPL